MMIFSPLPCRSPSAVPAAPETSGAPTLTWSPSAPRRMSSKRRLSPGPRWRDGRGRAWPGPARSGWGPGEGFLEAGAPARLDVDGRDAKRLARLGPELLAAGADDGVHGWWTPVDR